MSSMLRLGCQEAGGGAALNGPAQCVPATPHGEAVRRRATRRCQAAAPRSPRAIALSQHLRQHQHDRRRQHEHDRRRRRRRRRCECRLR
eukprot:6202162-Pleurochrysis_carterae.AAC.11